MYNPYFELHKEFKAAGARILLSSGQACVLLGIAAFSKDGDWIIHEDEDSLRAVLAVLNGKCASYRLGAPLDLKFLSAGWTSHFEFFREELRVRVDFVSRPPRISDPAMLWGKAAARNGIDLVDIEDLLLLKQTRRPRDYAVIGALAEVCGFNENIPFIALRFLQDYDLLKIAVGRWPDEAASVDRKAVRLLLSGASRHEVVAALAIEQDERIEADNQRINASLSKTEPYQRAFSQRSATWRRMGTPLIEQHEELLQLANRHLTAKGIASA